MKRLLAALIVFLAAAAQAAPAAGSPSRGELLYGTHCIACHNSQMHWRDKRLASDWPKLLAQVRHWQGVAQLGWSEDDILDVARHLNDRIYRHPVSGDKATSMRESSSLRHLGFTAASLHRPTMTGKDGGSDAGTAPAHAALVRPDRALGGAPEVTSPGLTRQRAVALRRGLGA
ncbi:hypothetical protein [Variovorax sp. YR752]|uniref:hypothetical protein n=1 Tax=Variovorax sp. YR752 TaxID=1884383 RepID=UPI003137B0F0